MLLDKSNDITVSKMLGVAIVYFSKKYNKVIYTYLCLIELDKCNADSIVKAIKIELMSKQLNIKKLVAIGTDNASVMVGVHNGVYKRLKTENSSLNLIKCVCHSLQLAISHVSSKCLLKIRNFWYQKPTNGFLFHQQGSWHTEIYTEQSMMEKAP